ncbi:MAG: DUF4412 domain-containing protein [Nitrospirae bacterium]|nr:MAG: DUF4412 domain-containing protein [Nitrospirota bacterium]
MLRHLCTLIVLAGVFGAIPVWATQLSRPQVEYSADSVMQTEEGTMEQHVYVTPAKERREMLTGDGDGSVQIFRFDSKVMWQVMPSQKMYMEHSTAKAGAKDMSQWDFEETVMGEEVLNGMKVTKYKTIATSTDGKKYGGFSWRTKEGISIKTDLLYKEGNEKKRMMTELKNVKVGKQDPKLFEVPEGFTKFDMAGMMGGVMGREGMDPSTMRRPGTNRPPTTRPGMTTPPEDVPANPEPEPSADDRSDMQKAGEAMKKLFGR